MSRTLLALAVAAAFAAAPLMARAGTSEREPLSGTWSGLITGQAGVVKQQRILIVMNARESGGTWRLGAGCYGSLKLDTISGGYHHYLRTPAPGATCAGGDIDCLKLAGRNLEDEVTSHLGGRWNSSGTLRRLSSS
jgi:hypothetical protein